MIRRLIFKLVSLLSVSFVLVNLVGAQTPASDDRVNSNDPEASMPAVQFETLFDFGVGNGEYPNATLAQGVDGSLYGTTEFGHAPSNGFAFKWLPLAGGRPFPVIPVLTQAVPEISRMEA